jgi:hypothetical protein
MEPRKTTFCYRDHWLAPLGTNSASEPSHPANRILIERKPRNRHSLTGRRYADRQTEGCALEAATEARRSVYSLLPKDTAFFAGFERLSQHVLSWARYMLESL